jgi:hypothetical protein
MMENIDMKKEIIFYGMHDSPIASNDCSKIKNLIDKIKFFSKNINIKR